MNADSYASTGQGMLGHNMFAYCLNNPINLIDVDGYMASVIAGAAALGGANIWNPIGLAALGVSGVAAMGYLGYAIYTYASSCITEIAYDEPEDEMPSPDDADEADFDDKYDEYYDDDNYRGGRERIGKSKGDAPRNNQNQKKQFREAARGLPKEVKRQIHDEITGMGYSFKEIKNTLINIVVIIITHQSSEEQ